MERHLITQHLIVLILTLCLIFSTSVGNSGGTDDMGKKLLVDINSKGKRIEVKVGDEVQIELKGVGSTGYEWHFDLLAHDLFEFTGKEKREIARQGDVVGTPYVAIWKLRAKTPGTSTIRMSYYRVWEGKEKAIDQFEIHVDVIP